MKRFLTKYALLSLAAVCGNASSLDLNGIAGGGNFNVSVKSFAEMKFKTVYKQQFDYSCGSAALASLLTFHYNDKVNEQSVFVDMFQHGDQEKIKVLGFSLLDMKNYLERRGYQSDGFKINLDQLITANSPAITIINTEGYLHFVIIKGVTAQTILVGDPAKGVSIIPRDKFEKMWENGVLFLIHADKGSGNGNFQSESEWNARLAPLSNGIDRSSLAEYHILMRGQVPGAFDF
ncbi:C39 family peptidase [Nitrosomonas sp. Is37]|uniref:C39 family peptidase n=1 Tax=Nitrosomonas sp. Is37 TaxID=3080535 RepID=UPI00294B0685|nr:C39 family peptidase [Nitrosomonas sp. Is37]MDV6344120.1 C39 family peptidase [Nitrosomonas sp. Is37]